jgi:hypothetical protein
MEDIEEKLEGIKNCVTEEKLTAIKNGLADPLTVICPFNRRYAQLPQVCISYQYVCRHLNTAEMACNHPENRHCVTASSMPDAGAKVD